MTDGVSKLSAYAADKPRQAFPNINSRLSSTGTSSPSLHTYQNPPVFTVEQLINPIGSFTPNTLTHKHRSSYRRLVTDNNQKSNALSPQPQESQLYYSQQSPTNNKKVYSFFDSLITEGPIKTKKTSATNITRTIRSDFSQTSLTKREGPFNSDSKKFPTSTNFVQLTSSSSFKHANEPSKSSRNIILNEVSPSNSTYLATSSDKASVQSPLGFLSKRTSANFFTNDSQLNNPSSFGRISQRSKRSIPITLPTEPSITQSKNHPHFASVQAFQRPNNSSSPEQLSPMMVNTGSSNQVSSRSIIFTFTDKMNSQVKSQTPLSYQHLKLSSTSANSPKKRISTKNNGASSSLTRSSVALLSDSNTFIKERRPSRFLVQAFPSTELIPTSWDIRLPMTTSITPVMNEKQDDIVYPWHDLMTWKPIIDDSIKELINKDSAGLFQWSILVEYLYGMTSLANSSESTTGLMHSNSPTTYMLESIKLMGFTPDISECVSDVISSVMANSYNVESPVIAAFFKIFRAYEAKYLRWSTSDKIGGTSRIKAISDTFFKCVQNDQQISTQFRLLDITAQQVYFALETLLYQKEQSIKSYFKPIKSFFKLPVFKISPQVFFTIREIFMKHSLVKSKISPTLHRRIALLAEQLRGFVVASLPQDTPFYEFHNDQTSEREQLSAPSRVAASIYNAFYCKLSIRTQLLRLPKPLGNKTQVIATLTGLICIVCMNNDESVLFYQVLQVEQYAQILLLTNDIFPLFAKTLMDGLKEEGVTKQFIQDTHKRLQHVRVLVHRARRSLTNGDMKSQDVCFTLESNITQNYCESGQCYFNELFKGLNYESSMMQMLRERVMKSDILQGIYRYDKVNRCEDHCDFVMNYFYSVTEVGSNRPKRYISAFDMQVYITNKKLTEEYFIEFKRILKEVFELSQFSFTPQLVNRLLSEYSYSLANVDLFFDKKEGDKEDIFQKIKGKLIGNNSNSYKSLGTFTLSARK